jgi:anti-sigma-K factor RskA
MADLPPGSGADVPEDRDLLAAELTLGLLEGTERAEALRLRLSDPAFAAMVDAWQHRLAPLLQAYESGRPGEGVWDGIWHRIKPRDLPEATGAPRKGWRAVALTASAIAAGLALFVALRLGLEAPTPQVSVAQLTSEAKALHVVARYDGAHGMLALRTTGIQTAAKSPELWVIPSDGKPRSLGLIAPKGQSEVEVPSALRAFLRDGATLAVTMEDAATAPHNAPTSTPIAVGSISVI